MRTAALSVGPAFRSGPAPPTHSRRVIQARSVDQRFLLSLQRHPFCGSVHSVFERVVNIEHDASELVTLASREVDNAPNTAVLNIANFVTSGICVGDRVTGVEEELHVGERIAVALSAASVWEHSLGRYPGANAGLSNQMSLARAYLGRYGPAGGMVANSGESNAFAREVSAALAQRATRLLDALAQGCHDCACRHAKSMLGLGPGLTPSGDDFLVGLFAVLNIDKSPCHGWLGSGIDVIDDAQSATNPISLAALKHAAEGRVRESIATLIGTLMYGTQEPLIDALRRVLAIGSTSGADIVAGILSGFELNLQVGAMRTRQ